ncbi:MAG: FtsW/RodA/SpoVE family cell cycle protein [Bacilli bacterium]
MRKLFSKIDVPLFVITIIFSVLGLIMIYSASSVSAVIRYHVPTYHFFIRQAIFIGVSFFVGIFIILTVPTRKYKNIALPAVIGIIVTLALLFVKGKLTNNVISWFDLGFFSLQPSEFAKSILIVFSAIFYSSMQKNKVKNIYAYLVPLVFGVIITGLVLMQPDLGGAAIIAGIVFLTFISIPTVKSNMLKVIKVMGVAIVIGVVVFVYSGQEILNSMQLKRLNFQEPCQRYTEETGYQVCNGFIAINNGHILGVGLGKSTQKYLYLPESHTDFIFPIIVEELGLITGVLVVLGYVFMLYRILKIAKESENLRCSVIAYGTFWFLTLHILVNLMGVLALIPLTGVPLPLLSYGGSFTVNVLGMLFLVQRVNIENKINKTNREIKAL